MVTIRKLLRSPIIFYALLYRLFMSFYIAHAPMGRKKALLSNHPDAGIRRSALISLGAQISESCHLNQGVRIVMDYPEKGRLVIKDRVAVAPNVQFICNSGPHPKSSLLDVSEVVERLMPVADITVESDVWIGAGAIILPGVTIGNCSVVGAGALVTSSVPALAIVAGSPAKVIRFLSQDNS